MSTDVLRSAGLFFCPLSALPDLIERERIPCLSDYLLFDFEVKPGWIRYSPQEVTVLSCNEMFKAIIYPVSGIARIHNHTTVKVKTKADYEHLVAMFKKPIILCVTRREQDSQFFDGFDMDFVVVLDPSHPKIAQELTKITALVQKHLRKQDKFYLTVDLSERLEELTPQNFKRRVMWLNCSFQVTNFHAPNPILSLNHFFLWVMLLPCCITVALPYRLYRKLRCVDEKIELNVHFRLNFSDAVPLALYFFSGRHPLPGRYKTQGDQFHLRACPATELMSLLHG